MANVSLVASAEGIKRARTALKRLNLTQMALVNERGIASWSTVNNFFNGKPVQRRIFIEICEELNLDWQDIVQSPESEEIPTTTLDKLWQQLQTLGSPTEQMGLVLVTEETLAWRWQSPSPYEKSVRLGSHIQFKINLETPGYLLLLQKDTSGQAWCFCPSRFAPQPQLDTGKTTLPQEGSAIASFPIEGKPGKEQILAVITQDVPTLDWLPQGSDEPLQLEDTHLVQLLEYVQSGNCKVLYTDYTITE